MTKRYVLINEDDADPSDLDFETGPIYPEGAPAPGEAASLGKDFALPHTCSVQSLASHDGYSPTYAAAVSYSCFIKYARKIIRNSEGADVISTAQIYFDGAVTIMETDRVTFDGVSPLILKIDRPDDEAGNRYATVVYT